MDNINPYEALARRLDSLPNGFPSAQDGAHLRILEHLFSPESAALAASLGDEYEPVDAIADRNGMDPAVCRARLKEMARGGLILAGKTTGGMGYKVMPFVVGIYEMQNNRMDAKLARLFENYFQKTFRNAMAIQPPFHRVIPVRESLQSGLSIAPFETAAGIVDRMAAWAVTPCICRKQKALIGEPCRHAVDNCMILADAPGVFHGRAGVRELTREEAHAVLRECAEAGLVHSVSNTRDGNWYICNCCTCSCGILRGLVEGGIAGVVAHSGFVSQVDAALCDGCGVCAEACPFTAITVEGAARVDSVRCAGCGICTLNCPNHALSLARRPEGAVAPVPVDETEWLRERAAWRTQNRG